MGTEDLKHWQEGNLEMVFRKIVMKVIRDASLSSIAIIRYFVFRLLIHLSFCLSVCLSVFEVNVIPYFLSIFFHQVQYFLATSIHQPLIFFFKNSYKQFVPGENPCLSLIPPFIKTEPMVYASSHVSISCYL